MGKHVFGLNNLKLRALRIYLTRVITTTQFKLMIQGKYLGKWQFFMFLLSEFIRMFIQLSFNDINLVNERVVWLALEQIRNWKSSNAI